jgi:hypothetical protein
MMKGLAAMDMHPIGEADETGTDAANRRNAALRRISAEQLLCLGARQVVYLTSVMRDGEIVFVLYGADGTPLARVNDIGRAVEIAADRRLEFVAVH